MFAGIGGFRSGLEAVGGFECIGHCEIDKHANMAYCAIYETEGEYYCDDARNINPDEMPDFDLLCAGFPCQSFSVAGKRLGFEDTRGTLFFEVARLLAAKRPAFFLLENVPGLLSHDGGKTLETIYATLIEMGYQEIPVLEPVEVFESSELKLPEITWEHLNAWMWPYIMKFASAEIKQILIKYDGKYHRCIKAAITDLCYEGIRSTWVPVGSAYWGNASILKTKRLAGGQQIFGNILYVQEDSSEDKEVLSRRMNDPEAVILGRLCDEIFGDG
ncbi:MAG: DNA (cytosine-5-)-methyltransferase [Oscillospiraceae bacterium]|nr:DNA (cytosine-5-)-methyltransferase [Oscillospiraceae bacterium]